MTNFSQATRTTTEKQRRLVRSGLSSGSAVLALMFAPQSLAQEVAPQPSGLEDIIVTARRVEERLQDVPVSITSLSDQELARNVVVSPVDLANKVPSLSVTTTGNQRDSLIYAIRGQGQAAFGAEPAVVTYFAEVPTISAGPGMLFDLQNVQVLKGPQGTLFGRNTTGGAILIEPQRPKRDFGGYVQFSYGNYNMRRGQGALNLPITDRLQVRLAADINRRDGFTQGINDGIDYDDRRYEAVRLGINWEPTDNFENYLLVDYSHSHTNGTGVVIDAVAPGGLLSLIFGQAPADALALQRTLGPRKTQSNAPFSEEETITTGITNVSTLTLSDNLLIKNIVGFRAYRHKAFGDLSGYPFPVLQTLPAEWDAGSNGDPSQELLSNEFQLQGSALNTRLKWIAGFYIEKKNPHSKTDAAITYQFGTPITISSLKYDRSRAVFAQGTYSITDKVRLTAGIRQTWDKRRQISSQYVVTPANCALAGADTACKLDLNAKFKGLTGNVVLDYNVTPSVLLYGTIRWGYKSGGFSNSAPTAAQRIFDPERVTTYETGIKADFKIASVPARLNLALYHNDFKKLQISGIANIGGAILAYTANAGSGYVRGFELEASIIPVDGLTISGNWGYTDPVYKNNNFAGQSGLNNVPFNNVPKNQYAVSGVYNFKVSDEDFSFSANYAHKSSAYFNVPQIPVNPNPNNPVPGYGLLNLQAQWSNMLGSGFDLSVFATNATNKVYKIFEGDLYAALGTSNSVYGEPRMYGATLKYNF